MTRFYCAVLGLALALPAMAAGNDDWRQLGKAAQAARLQPLAGSYLHQVGSATETFRIQRSVQKGQVRERRESLDGLPREIIRHGSELISAAPDEKALLAAKASAAKLFPAVLPEDIEPLRQSYSLARLGRGRIASRDCQWLELRPREAQQRYVQRLCLDDKTQLPLKTMTLNGKGAVAESFNFIDLDLSSKRRVDIRPHYALASKSALSAPQAAERLNVPLELKGMPAGFQLMHAVTRVLPGNAPAGPVQHFVYSDGLVMLSVFVEPEGAAHPTPAHAYGTLSVVSDEEGRYQLTLVGDLPESGLRAIARHLRIIERP